MDRFIGDLRRCTHQLKEGYPAHTFGGVTLCYSSRHPQVDDVVVLPCDRYLLVHWKNFVKALAAYEEQRSEAEEERQSSPSSSSSSEGWWLANIEVPIEIRKLLKPILTTRKNLRTLILDNNQFGRGGVDFLCNIVERNSYLKRISFHNNLIEDDADLARFCEAVSRHASLEHVTLENIGLEGDDEKLAMILNSSKNLQCLGLSNNGIGSRRASEMITRFLATSQVKIVYLRENSFGDETAEHFALSLKDNHHLRVMDLSDNQFTSSGRTIIHNAVFDTSSLSAAIDSNHTCVVYIDEAELKDKLGVINCKGTQEENKHKKVFSILYATTVGGQLGQLLKDIPLGLMPEAMDYVQDFYLDDIPRGMRRHAMEALRDYSQNDFDEMFARQTIFTVMFEVLRSWNLPLLYTNL